MQMAPGGVARRARVADELTAPDVATVDEDRRQVVVGRHEIDPPLDAVVDGDAGAVAAAPPGAEHGAGCRGIHRSAARDAEVGAAVQLPHVQDRVETHPELRGDRTVGGVVEEATAGRVGVAGRRGVGPARRGSCGGRCCFGLLPSLVGFPCLAGLFDEQGLQPGLLGLGRAQPLQLVGLAALDLTGIRRLFGDQ